MGCPGWEGRGGVGGGGVSIDRGWVVLAHLILTELCRTSPVSLHAVHVLPFVLFFPLQLAHLSRLNLCLGWVLSVLHGLHTIGVNEVLGIGVQLHILVALELISLHCSGVSGGSVNRWVELSMSSVRSNRWTASVTYRLFCRFSVGMFFVACLIVWSVVEWLRITVLIAFGVLRVAGFLLARLVDRSRNISLVALYFSTSFSRAWHILWAMSCWVQALQTPDGLLTVDLTRSVFSAYLHRVCWHSWGWFFVALLRLGVGGVGIGVLVLGSRLCFGVRVMLLVGGVSSVGIL